MRCLALSRYETLKEEDVFWFGAILLKDVQTYLKLLVQYGSDGTPIIFKLKVLMSHILAHICQSNRPATAVKLLEVFLNPETYRDKFGGMEQSICSQVVESIVAHGYYKTLLSSLISKVDSNLELLPGQGPPSGFQGAILQLMILPLIQANEDQVFRTVTSYFLSEVVSSSLPLVSRFILPAFLLNKSVCEKLPVVICSCLLHENANLSTHPISIISMFWFLIRCILSVENLDRFSESEYSTVVACLADLLQRLPVADRDNASNEEMNKSDDSEDEMDFSPQPINTSDWHKLPDFIQYQHSEVIDSLCHERTFAMFLRQGARCVKGDAACRIAQIFYELIYRHGVSLSKMRGSTLPIFDRELLRCFYEKLRTMQGPVQYLTPTTILQRVQSGLALQLSEYNLFVPIFTVFAKFFHLLLLCVHDAEFDEQNQAIPFNKKEIANVTSTFRSAIGGLVEILRPQTLFEKTAVTQSKAYIPMFRSACHLLRHLYLRNCRMNFLPDGFWSSIVTKVQPVRPVPNGLVLYLLEPISPEEDTLLIAPSQQDFDPSSTTSRAMSSNEVHLAIVLTYVPFLLPFEYRHDIFKAVLARDRDANFRSRPAGLDEGMTIDIRIRRQYLYEDAFDRLSQQNAPNLKKRIRCHLINFTGLDEAGIDGGGLFREFITELVRTAFDPNRGLFCFTPSQDPRLYPNPAAESFFPDDWKNHFYFLGRILGKIIYENILVELPLADFFLAKVLSRDATPLDIHYLEDLDSVLYKNLLFLKNYTGNVEDLGLDFTVSDDTHSMVQGGEKVVELIHNGKQTPVTAENRIQYTYLMADYKLNKRISGQCRAFFEGLSDVIDIDWLRMFTSLELQTLVSGALKAINVDDLMANTKYAGVYSSEHPSIQIFWNVVKNRMTEEQRRKLLRFVTSCSRPPMFGFKVRRNLIYYFFFI